MKKHIPNTITCCNLVCGCIATYHAFNSAYGLALVFIILGALFDFFDGFSARLLHVSSPVGKELDSLADDITFGFAPSAIIFSLLSDNIGQLDSSMAIYLPYIAFLVAAFSGLRLAKFNLDERQTQGFIGLPTPANALFWATLGWILRDSALEATTIYGIVVGVFVSAWLLVCEVPMFALKFKHFGWAGNGLRYSFIATSAVLLLLLQDAAFAVIIPLYIAVSIANNMICARK